MWFLKIQGVSVLNYFNVSLVFSTSRVDHSNTRLSSQLDRNPGKVVFVSCIPSLSCSVGLPRAFKFIDQQQLVTWRIYERVAFRIHLENHKLSYPIGSFPVMVLNTNSHYLSVYLRFHKLKYLV